MKDYTPKTDSEIRDLAVARIAGQLWTDRDVPPGELSTTFMPLGLMGVDELREFGGPPHEPVLIYEHIRKAAPRSVNGHPTFFSFQALNRGDLERLNAAIEKIQSLKETSC